MKAGTSNDLLDWSINKLDLRNDADLARKLSFSPGVISKLRHGHLSVGPALLVKIHEATGVPTKELKKIVGMV